MIRTGEGFVGGSGRMPGHPDSEGRSSSIRQIAQEHGLGAVVLAGVHHWGGSVLDEILPRPLLPIANRPLITYSLDWLSRAGLSDICICANSSTNVIREHLLQDSQGETSLHFYEDVMPRGPAGCVRDAWSGMNFETFVVVDGTVVPRLDLSKVLKAHWADGSLMTVVVSSKRKPGRTVEDALMPTGIHILDRRALDYVPDTGYQDIKEKLIPRLYSSGERLTTYVADVAIPRVSSTDSYIAVSDWVVELGRSINAEVPSGYRREGDALVHETAHVSPSASLIGPVVVGAGSTLMGDATLVGPTTVGDGCVVEDGAVISRSFIWNHVSIGARAVLDRCVLVDDTYIEAETSLRSVVWRNGKKLPPLRSAFSLLSGLASRG